jgi:hypothetical protein
VQSCLATSDMPCACSPAHPASPRSVCSRSASPIGVTRPWFSIVKPVLCATCPIPRPDRIEAIYERGRDGSAKQHGLRDLPVDWRRESRSIDHGSAVVAEPRSR